ncbi:MAG: GxxExxY protein [Phycisphaerales bacterium]
MANEYHRDEGYRGGGGGGGGGRGGYGRGGGGRGGHERRGIPLSALDASTTEASRKLIGAAIEVHKTLGPGFDHAAYTNALKMELDALGVGTTSAHKIKVNYKDKAVSEAVADMFVDGKFFVEVLARPGAITTFERLALRAKLKAADLELGLIINFAERRLKDGLVRVVNIDKIQKEKGLSFEDEHDDGGEGGHESGMHEFDQH